MVSRSEMYRQSVEILRRNDIPDSGFDAMCIFQNVFGERNPMFLPQENVSEEHEEQIRGMIKRRSEGEPLQYILGEWDFWNCTFKVGEGVLIPRPDTETLIEDVLKICRRKNLRTPKIADLCSGSGCIAITLKKEIPTAEVYALELSEQAMGYLKRNSELNGAEINIIAADVLDDRTAEKFRELDIIVTNPPYLTASEMNELQPEVRREPYMALFGGNDGLDFYRRLAPLWRDSLKKGGSFCCEFGMGQHDAVKQILHENHFINIEFSKDAGGIIRTATAETEE